MTSQIRILAVDDYPDITDALSTLFRSKGATCDTAGGLREAVRKFNSACDAGAKCYDAIILDVDLRMVSGIGLLKLIRPLLPEVPAFILTGYDSPLVRLRAKQLKAEVDEKPLLDANAFVDKVVTAALAYQISKPPSDHARLILPEVVEEILRHSAPAIPAMPQPSDLFG